MPIPPYDHNLVLPPHSGNPTDHAQLTPYRTTTLELVQTFATTPARVEILKGLTSFRQEIFAVGVNEGFQLLDGSFLTNIETLERRDPRDIDVVSFIWGSSVSSLAAVAAQRPDLFPPQSKSRYKVDNYWVTDTRPDQAFEQAIYWTSLFSHTRGSVWKGMLRIELGQDKTDAEAEAWLASASKQGEGAK